MIYTSYYGKLRELAKNGIEPIAISRGIPQNFAGRRITELAPTWAMLKMSDEDYNEAYEKILARVDRDALAKSFEGKDVALLCWEKDVNECHRKRVAEWLREGGYEVEEFQTKQEKAKREKEEEKKVETAKIAEIMSKFEQLCMF